MKENLDLIFSSMNSQMVMYSVIVSIIIGVILVLAGMHFKKKGKEWWLILSLLGVASIVINGIKLLQISVL